MCRSLLDLLLLAPSPAKLVEQYGKFGTVLTSIVFVWLNDLKEGKSSIQICHLQLAIII